MLYDNSTFEHEGVKFRVTFPADEDSGAPWENEDGHGPVSEWKRHPFGHGTKPPKAPGERILVWESGSYRTYDFQEALKIARRDGWDAPPYGTGTKRQQALRAVEADFKRLEDWCNDRWQYVGVVVELLDADGDAMGETESLWGIESDCSEYLEETAHELAGEILARLSVAPGASHGACGLADAGATAD